MYVLYMHTHMYTCMYLVPHKGNVAHTNHFWVVCVEPGTYLEGNLANTNHFYKGNVAHTNHSARKASWNKAGVKPIQ